MTEAILKCRGLSMHFGGLLALNEFDIDVKRGEIVGLLGPNGSGKTTFFNVLSGLYKATAGTTVFDGNDISGRSPRTINKAGIARSFQRCRLMLDMTVFDNLAIGAHHQDSSGLLSSVLLRKRLRGTLDDLTQTAREICAVFSKDIADGMFRSARSFNMIDRRRIELCRALIGKPRLLLLDEPSAGMTHDETSRLMDDVLAFQRSQPDLSIILIEHEMQIIEKMSQRCVVLNFGKKICEGSYRHVVDDPLVRQAYLGEDA